MSEQRKPPYLILYTETTRTVNGEERTYRNRAGVAFPLRSGVGFSLHVDENLAVLNSACILPPLERRDAPQDRPAQAAARPTRPAPRPTRPGAAPPAAPRGDFTDDFDIDEIPF